MPKVIKVTVTGDWGRTRRYLKKVSRLDPLIIPILKKYGEYGVQNLELATPKDTGKTAMSWSYRIEGKDGSYQLIFDNSNKTVDGTPVVVLLQYGHGTKSGGYVQGYDFINPALQPIFNELAEKVWEEVSKL